MLNLILLRIWRERRLLSVLLLSICLVTGFLSLGPLYVRAIAAADFDQRVANAENVLFQIDIRNESPLLSSVSDIINNTMADYVRAVRNYHTKSSFSCGNTLRDGESVLNVTSCYRPVAYNQLTDLFTIVEGKMPDSYRLNDDNDIIVEALTTVPNIEKSNVQLGDMIVFSNREQETIRIQIVGIAEPALDPSNPFWEGQTMLDITRTPLGNEDYRFDLTLAVDPQAYDDYLISILGGNPTYFYRVDLDRTTLSSNLVDDLEASVYDLQTRITNRYPEVSIRTWLTTLVDNYREGIAKAQFPVILLSFLVLVLMLYNIYTTASLILEQQGEEWAIIASRGASNRQLVWIQFFTVFIMGAIAFAIGPVIAYFIMLILSLVGPQADILEFSHLGHITLFSYALSGIAGIVAIICLTLPAWAAANKSLSRLKQGLSRPPTLPAWSRFYLDVILLAIGLSLLLRLYVLSTNNDLSTLVTHPASLLQMFATQDVADFTDVFNLAVPALLLTGASLLWMRIFPVLMRLGGHLFANGDGLTTRLAFWNVERDPAHYAQLVLLLIGTLALGTASLALSNTRELGAWQTARQEVGGDLLVSLDVENLNRTTDWASLPDVKDALPLLIVETGNRRDGALIGVDLTKLNAESYPDFATTLEPLIERPSLDLGGLEIPANTNTIAVDVFADAPTNDIPAPLQTRINMEILDSLGFTIIVPLITDDETLTGTFATYRADIANLGVEPYVLIALHWESQQASLREIQQTAYLDNLVALDAQGNVSLLEGFEEATYSRWQWASESRLRQVLETTAFANNREHVTQGETSLRVLYTTRQNSVDVRDAVMNYRGTTRPPIPAIVSSQFALTAGQRSRFNRSLQIGDTMSTTILIPFDLSATGDVEITYTIVGIYDEFLGYESASYLIADVQEIRRWLNSIELFGGSFGDAGIYDINVIRLDLAQHEPTPDLIAAIEAQSDVVSYQTAWIRFTEIQREPLANAVTGILFAGFWVSLSLGLMDFAFYMAVTIRRRALSFATLQAIGWNESDLLTLLSIEQAAFIAPALLIGMLFGVFLAYLILPFLALVGSVQLQIPWLQVTLLVFVLTSSFILILRLTARALRHMSVNKIMRFGE